MLKEDKVNIEEVGEGGEQVGNNTKFTMTSA